MITLFHRHHRPLTANECDLLRPIYQDSIDYARIRIHKGRFMPFQHRTTAMTPFGTMHAPPDLYCEDYAQAHISMRHLFVHEMAHVWQYQLGLPLWWHGLLLTMKGGYHAQACYAYTGSLKNCTHLSQFNMEQQADLIADWFVFRHQQASTQSIMRDFIHNPNNPDLLPKRTHFARG